MCVPLNTAFVDRSIMRLVGRQVESSSDFRLPEDFVRAQRNEFHTHALPPPLLPPSGPSSPFLSPPQHALTLPSSNSFPSFPSSFPIFPFVLLRLFLPFLSLSLFPLPLLLLLLLPLLFPFSHFSAFLYFPLFPNVVRSHIQFIDITFAEVSDSLMARHPSMDGHDALLSLDEARHGWKSVLAQTSGMTVQDFYA